MKKLVLKTALITVGGIIGFFALLFGVFALAFPKVVADIGAKTGNYGVAVTFYERQYNLSGSATDLANLIETLDEDKDAKKTADYSRKFLSECEGYGAFIESSVGSRFNTQLSAEEFYYGKCVRALINTEEYPVASEYADKFFVKNGYSAHNPYCVIVSVVCSGKVVPAEWITELKDDITDKKTGRPATETELMDFDISQLSQLQS